MKKKRRTANDPTQAFWIGRESAGNDRGNRRVKRRRRRGTKVIINSKNVIRLFQRHDRLPFKQQCRDRPRRQSQKCFHFRFLSFHSIRATTTTKKKKLLHVPHGRHWAMKRGAIIRPTISCRRGGGFVCEKQDNLRQVINHQRTFELETTHTAVVHAGSVVQCTYLDETNHLRGETNTRNITEEKKRPQGRSQSSLPRAYVWRHNLHCAE